MNAFISTFGNLAEKTYVVGGFLRDELIGIPSNDLDFVVEATEEEFRKQFPHAQTVGNEFPVYLINGHEVALTRNERSTGPGYSDFEVTCGVSIIDDLKRRDITINSIARNILTGEIVDPYNGMKDIKEMTLRAINPNAFEEDPVRILRVARFAARFCFSPDIKTIRLMAMSVHKLQFVTKERLVIELEKLWKQTNECPSEFFNLLFAINGLKYILPEIDALEYVTAGPVQFHHGKTALQHTMEVVDRVKMAGGSFTAFIAALFHDVGKGTTPKDILPKHIRHENRGFDIITYFLKRNRFDSHVNAHVPNIVKNHMRIHHIPVMSHTKLIRFAQEIKRYMDDFYCVVNADHPLTDEQNAVYNKIRLVNKYKFSPSDIEMISKAKDKKTTVERILVSYYRTL